MVLKIGKESVEFSQMDQNAIEFAQMLLPEVISKELAKFIKIEQV